MQYYSSIIDSPMGKITLFASDKGVTKIQINPSEIVDNQSNKWSKLAALQLKEYFSDDRKHFNLEYDFIGYSDFYISVWEALIKIPYGDTYSYLDIASQINNPKAVRAVGMANGKNPIGIIVPCHRVIGADGSLTGYAHGLDMKRWLLEFEGAIEPDRQLSLY
ncbi:MAG: methylated-DNA--[protein]-cysteine S-methyltransferase [Saprospiraceae bacterium]